MTGETGLAAYIARAESHLQSARHCWDPSSISGCAQCAGHLQQAIDEIRAGHQAATEGPVAAGVKARLAQLRSQGEVLSRLVDSAMAFSRGLALRTAGEEPVHSELKG